MRQQVQQLGPSCSLCPRGSQGRKGAATARPMRIAAHTTRQQDGQNSLLRSEATSTALRSASLGRHALLGPAGRTQQHRAAKRRGVRTRGSDGSRGDIGGGAPSEDEEKVPERGQQQDVSSSQGGRAASPADTDGKEQQQQKPLQAAAEAAAAAGSFGSPGATARASSAAEDPDGADGRRKAPNGSAQEGPQQQQQQADISAAAGGGAGNREEDAAGADGAGAQAEGARVPWTWVQTVEVMVLWVIAFWLLGNWLVPLGLEFLGLGTEDLTPRGHALLHLVVDLGELGGTLGILWLRLRSFRPWEKGWFPVRWRGFWILQVLLTCCLFPVVDWLALVSQSILPTDSDEWAASLEQSLSGGDPITNAIYFFVVSVCAPIWEEVIFRGFLLPSLHRYLPICGAVAVSSVLFAMAHFSAQRFFPLVFLGIIMGTLYVRSKNLLSCITLHSFWNLYIFWQLAAQGAMS